MRSSHILAVALAAGVAVWLWSGQRGADAPAAAGAGTDGPASAQESAGAAAPASAPARVRVAASAAQPYVVTLTLTGQTAPDREIDLRALSSGRIEAVEVEAGELVEEGAAIARLAAADRPQRLALAEARVARFQVEFDASAELAEGGWRSETATAEALAELRGARAELAEIRVDIGNTRIAAPFGGVVERVDVELGDAVTAGSTPIARLFDLDPIVVVAAVSERKIGLLEVGDAGLARTVSGAAFEGVLRFVGRIADPATRTYRIELEAANPGHAIPAGMTAEIVLPLETAQAHFIEPSALSLAADGALGVKVVNDANRVELLPVEILATAPGGMWLGGLPPRIALIVVGHAYVQAGDLVEPVPVGNAGDPAPS